jgi:hypothetical protein
MIKKLIITLVFSIYWLLPFNLFADQLLIGVGLSPQSGQPDYQTDRSPIMIAFETKTLWRFSYTDTAFKHKDDSSSKIKARILGAERMWIYEISKGFSLIGAFGPGYYSVRTENQDGSGIAFGMMATGTFRFELMDSIFIEGALQYRNVAVDIDDGTVDGGYQGLMFGGGYFF